jgi:serine/threonine-protein kinase RsbW
VRSARGARTAEPLLTLSAGSFGQRSHGYLGPVTRADTETLAALEVEPVRDPLVVVELELPRGRRFAAVARLVAAGFGARLGLPVDRLEDLKLAIDVVLRQPHSTDALTLALTPTSDDLEVEVGPLVAAGHDSRGLEDVLSTLVDDIRARRSGRDVWIAMRIRRPGVVARGRAM